jgi:hypothetical protein
VGASSAILCFYEYFFYIYVKAAFAKTVKLQEIQFQREQARIQRDLLFYEYFCMYPHLLKMSNSRRSNFRECTQEFSESKRSVADIAHIADIADIC